MNLYISNVYIEVFREPNNKFVLNINRQLAQIHKD